MRGLVRIIKADEEDEEAKRKSALRRRRREQFQEGVELIEPYIQEKARDFADLENPSADEYDSLYRAMVMSVNHTLGNLFGLTDEERNEEVLYREEDDDEGMSMGSLMDPENVFYTPAVEASIKRAMNAFPKLKEGLKSAKERFENAYQDAAGIPLEVDKGIPPNFPFVNFKQSMADANKKITGRGFGLNPRQLKGILNALDKNDHMHEVLVTQLADKHLEGESFDALRRYVDAKRARKERRQQNRKDQQFGFDDELNELAQQAKERGDSAFAGTGGKGGMGSVKRDQPDYVRVVGPSGRQYQMRDEAASDEEKERRQKEAEEIYGETRAQSKRARSAYDRFFQDADVGERYDRDRGRTVSAVQPKTLTPQAKGWVERTKEVMNERGMDEESAFKVVQSQYDQYLRLLLQAPGVGGSGRGGVVRSPSGVTPSMRQAARELGLNVGAVNMPDAIAQKYMQTANAEEAGQLALDMDERSRLADEIGALNENQRKNILHPALQRAEMEGGILSTLFGDAGAQVMSDMSGPREEMQARAGEARAAGGRLSQTMAGIMDEGQEKRFAQGGDKAQEVMNFQLRDIENAVKAGLMDEHSANMNMQRIREGKMSIQSHLPDEEGLNNIRGDHFLEDDPNHIFAGKSPEFIRDSLKEMMSDLLGTGRLLHDVNTDIKRRVDMQIDHNDQRFSDGEIDANMRRQLNQKLLDFQSEVKNLDGEDLLNIGSFTDTMREIDDAATRQMAQINMASAGEDAQMSEEEAKELRKKVKEAAVKKFDDVVSKYPEQKRSAYTGLYGATRNAGGETLFDDIQTMVARTNRATERLEKLGFSNEEVLNAAMEYANADMTMEGYEKMMERLRQTTKVKGKQSVGAIYDLLKAMESAGAYQARNDNHHQAVIGQQQKMMDHLDREEEDKDEEDKEEGLGHDPFECVACRPERHANYSKEEAQQAFGRGKETPYYQKMIGLPVKESGNFVDMKGNTINLFSPQTGTPGLLDIINYIHPGMYSQNGLENKIENAVKYASKDKKKGAAGIKRGKLARQIMYQIREAIMTGNPRAMNLQNRFGLRHSKQQSVASGAAGMTSKERAFLGALNGNETYDKAYNRSRLNTLNFVRQDALRTALDIAERGIRGEIDGVAPADFASRKSRAKFVKAMKGKPQMELENLLAKMKLNRRALAATESDFREFKEWENEWKKDWEKTKPKNEYFPPGHEKEGQIKRKIRPEFNDKQKKALIEQYEEFADRKRVIPGTQDTFTYRSMMQERRSLQEELKGMKHKKDSREKMSEEDRLRYNDYALGVFIAQGDAIVSHAQELAQMPRKKDGTNTKRRDRAFESMIEGVFNDLYDENDETILTYDGIGGVNYDKRHSTENWMIGRPSETAGSGIHFTNNNLARMRPTDKNQVAVLRRMLGLNDLTEEEEKQQEAIAVDSENAGSDAFAEYATGRRELGDADHSEAKARHHDAEPDEMGLLSEAEGRRRHQNHHIARQAMKDGELDVDALKNFKNIGATLCGTCHGHGWFHRDDALSWMRNHIPQLKEVKSVQDPRAQKYIAEHMRPRDTPSHEDHEEHGDGEMDLQPHEHDQIACPDCQHADASVRGGVISNGICGHCFGDGEIHPQEISELLMGYRDADGNRVHGAGNHAGLNAGILASEPDALNEFLSKNLDKIMAAQRPSSQMYQNWANQGMGVTTKDMIEQAIKNNNFSLVPKGAKPGWTERKKSATTPPVPTEDYLNRQRDRGEDPPKPKPEEEAIPAAVTPESAKSPVHQAKTDAHHAHMIENRAKACMAIIKRLDGEEENIQTAQNLYDRLMAIERKDANGEGMGHAANQLLARLQEMADEAYKTDFSLESFKVRDEETGRVESVNDPKESARRRDLSQPLMTEEGGFNYKLSDYIAGKPIIPHGVFPTLQLHRGRHATPEEIGHGVFDLHDPKPMRIRDTDIKEHYHNKAARKAFKRSLTHKKGWNDARAKTIGDTLNKDGGAGVAPLMNTTVEGIASPDLEAIAKDFSGKLNVPPARNVEGVEWNDRFLDAMKQKGIPKSALATYLQHPITVQGKQMMRPLNTTFTDSMRQAIKPLFLNYAKHELLKRFLTQHNSPIYHPTLRQDLTPANFYEELQKTGDGAQMGRFMDEAVQLAGYDSIAEFDKKASMKSGGRLAKAGISPSAFKEKVMERATRTQKGQVPLPNDVDQLIENADYAMYPLQDRQLMNMVRDLERYRKYPNKAYEEDMHRLFEGAYGDAGFDNVDEMMKAYEEKALPQEMMDKMRLPLSKGLLFHPTWRPAHLTAQAAYDHADRALNPQIDETGRMSNEEMRNLSLYGRRDPIRPFNVDLSSREQQAAVPRRSPFGRQLPSSPIQQPQPAQPQQPQPVQIMSQGEKPRNLNLGVDAIRERGPVKREQQ